MDGFSEVGGVDVRDEPERHRTIGVVPERLERHHRAEIGAADTDVDDVSNALAGVPFPLSAANPVGEVRHPIEHFVDAGHDVLAVGDDRRSARRAQCHVQDGAVFGEVDVVAAEHRFDSRTEA